MAGPRLLRSLGRLLLPARHREFIIGDLDELYSKRVREDGRTSADLRYLRGVLASAVAQRLGRGVGPSSRRPTEAQRGGVFGDAAADLGQTVRSLGRRPAFTFMVVAIIALGVGPAAAVFGMVNQLLLRPVPGVANTERAAYLQLSSAVDQNPLAGIRRFDFDELRRGATLLEGMASSVPLSLIATVGDGRPVRVRGTRIYGDYFEILGVAPVAGRLLSAAETGVEAEPLVAVISERLRDQLFGPSEDAIGRTMLMEEQSVTVVGVAGGGFSGPGRGSRTDAWFPLSAMVPLLGMAPERLLRGQSTSHNNLIVLPREGVTLEAAEAQIAEILSRLGEGSSEIARYMAQLRPRLLGGLHTSPLAREQTYSALRLMAWAVGLILAIACANVANLLLFRNLARRGALATRRALGASSGRIARQHITESLILGVLGSVVGIGVAWLIALPFRGQRLLRIPAFEGFTLDWAVLGFVAATAVGTALIFGVVPAVLAGRFNLRAALLASQTRDTGQAGPLRSALSVGQIALTLSLMVGGLLMARTIANLYAIDTGVDIEGVAKLTVNSPRDLEADELQALQRRLLDGVLRLPEIDAAALDLYGPHSSAFFGRLNLIEAPQAEPIRAMMFPVTPGWFDLFGVGAIAGRTFQDSDWGSSSQGGVVLTASLARRLFGRTDVAGRTLLAGPRGLEERRIVGVVRDYRSAASPAEPTDAFFVTDAFFAMYAVTRQMTLLVRTNSFNPEVAGRVRTVVESTLPGIPVPDPHLVSEDVDAIHQEKRMLSRLLWILSGFGVLMSGVGLYGVIVFAVSHRKREFGIRLALGADSAQIMRLVLGSAVTIVAAGTALGMLGAYGLSRLLESRLFGVETFDLTSYAGAAALLAMVAALACLAPARAALRSDPVATLRQE